MNPGGHLAFMCVIHVLITKENVTISFFKYRVVGGKTALLIPTVPEVVCLVDSNGESL